MIKGRNIFTIIQLKKLHGKVSNDKILKEKEERNLHIECEKKVAKNFKF
jgi:hypothetical protein